jgi:hypothetical protein
MQMNKEALEFVMELYQVDRITALQLYWDEIKEYEWLLNKQAEQAKELFDE